MRLIGVIFFVFCKVGFLYSQNLTTGLDIDFIKNGKLIEAKEYDVFIIFKKSNNKIIIKPNVDSTYFFVPDICNSDYGLILIRHKQKYYTFGFHKLKFAQNVKIILGFDKNYFLNKNILFIRDNRNIQAQIYIQFNPLESGDGVSTITSIYNYRQYLRGSKKIFIE